MDGGRNDLMVCFTDGFKPSVEVDSGAGEHVLRGNIKAYYGLGNFATVLQTGV